MDGGVKKWFMLQVWRLQQVAQLMTIVLLALNLSLAIFGLIKWREDSPLSTSWIGVPVILLVIASIVWSVAIVWDLKLRMWREQQTVVVERNPYAKEKLTSKEIVLYGLMWLPVMEKLSKDDPKLREAVVIMRDWIKKALASDSVLPKDVKELFEHIGKDGSGLLGLDEKP